MTAIEVQLGDTTVTRQLLSLCPWRGDRIAVAAGPDRPCYSYAELAELVNSAAAGLTLHGLQPRDIVAVYVPDAMSYVLATHAIRAAGGVPTPVAAGLAVPEIAGQLADCGARILLTGAPLSAAGLAAADRSWVRLVVSFEDAAGAIPLRSLLRPNGAGQPAAGARPDEVALLPYARRPDGSLAPEPVTHDALARQLRDLAAAEIGEGDVVLAAPPTGDGRRYTALVDHMLISGASIIARTGEELAAGDFGGHRAAAAIVPAGADIGGPRRELRVFTVPG